MVSLHLIFYAFLELWFPDVESNPGPCRPVPEACRILCSNVQGPSKNLSNVTVASSQYVCSETLVSDRCHISEFLVAGFRRNVLLCRDGMPQAHGMAAYVRDGYGAFRQPKFWCGCCEMLVFRVCAAMQNINVLSLYRNPDLDDRIYGCLLTAMAAEQASDERASFMFVGNINGHHQND